jgi:hypothetical protein
MKALLVVLAVLVGLVVLFVAGRIALVLVSSTPPRAVASTTRVGDGVLICMLTLTSDRPMSITSLDAPRAQATALGLSAPIGFKVEPLPAGSDAEFANRWNTENIRFIGNLQLQPGEPTDLRIPITSDGSQALVLKGQIEGKWGVGGTASFFQIVHPSTSYPTKEP